VQSAVRPALHLAATLGASCLPRLVAPTRIEEGCILFIKSQKALWQRINKIK
jgi:hypothetical protein